MKCQKCGAELNSRTRRCTRFPICSFIETVIPCSSIRDTSYIILDFETTGVKKTDTIIEIGAVKVANNKIIDKFSMLVSPGFNEYGDKIYINKNIENITGIKNADLIGQKSEIEAIKLFADWVGEEKVVVGQNIITFDFRYLKKACKNANINFPFTEVIDTLRVAGDLLQMKKKGLVTSLSQTSLAEYYGFTYSAHRALDDVEALFKIFNFLLNDADKQSIVIQAQKI